MKTFAFLTMTATMASAQDGQSGLDIGSACPAEADIPLFVFDKAACGTCADSCVVKAVEKFDKPDENKKEGKVTCGCEEDQVELPKEGDECPSELEGYKITACDGDCEECKVKTVTEKTDEAEGAITCECEEDTSNPPPPSYAEFKAGDQCDEDALEKAGITVTDHCCDALENDECADNTFCRIAKIDEKSASCSCVVAPKEKDLCDDKTLWPKTAGCEEYDDCKDCRVTKVNGKGHDAEVECGCAECPDTKPECTRAYDDNAYCQCKPPTTQSTGVEVSVCSDALYLLKDVDVTEVCSGSDETKIGKCPKKGDEAASDCRDNIFSSKDGKCFAPEDAQCVMLRSGAMGCVFPTNANARLGCLTENVCNDNYEKDPETQQCVTSDNDYCKQNASVVAEEDYVDTTDYKSPPAKEQTYLKSATGLAIAANVMSILAGAVAAAGMVYGSI